MGTVVRLPVLNSRSTGVRRAGWRSYFELCAPRPDPTPTALTDKASGSLLIGLPATVNRGRYTGQDDFTR